jgi:hypothetical protein
MVKLNITLGPEYYADDISNAEVRGTNTKAHFNGTPLLKQPDGTYVAIFESQDSLVQYQIVNPTRSQEAIPGTNADDYYSIRS